MEIILPPCEFFTHNDFNDMKCPNDPLLKSHKFCSQHKCATLDCRNCNINDINNSTILFGEINSSSYCHKCQVIQDYAYAQNNDYINLKNSNYDRESYYYKKNQLCEIVDCHESVSSAISKFCTKHLQSCYKCESNALHTRRNSLLWKDICNIYRCENNVVNGKKFCTEHESQNI